MTKDTTFQPSNKNKFVSLYYSNKLRKNEDENLKTASFKFQIKIKIQFFLRKIEMDCFFSFYVIFQQLIVIKGIGLKISLRDCVAYLFLENQSAFPFTCHEGGVPICHKFNKRFKLNVNVR